MEHLCLRIGFARQHEYRLDVEWRGAGAVGGPFSGGQPRLVVAEQRPDRAMMFRFVRFEVEIQRDERPAGAIAGLQRLLDDRPDAFEEILAKGGSFPSYGSPCDTIDRAGRPSPAGRHTRSCSMATGSPVASARSMRSRYRPL